jgi:hypothetical protein
MNLNDIKKGNENVKQTWNKHLQGFYDREDKVQESFTGSSYEDEEETEEEED